MTRILTVFLAVLCVISCAVVPVKAYAEQEYEWARITKDSVNLFADADCTKTLFTLEKSYYVEIVESLDRVYMVTVMQNKTGFPSILGYVRKIEASPVEAAPLKPVYPTEQIYVTADSAQLKLLPMLSSENVIVATTTQKLSYYGKMSYYGKDWYYVYCGGKFGYVDAESVSKPNIELHPTPLETSKPVVKPTDPDDGSGDATVENPSKTPTAEILLIVFVVLMAAGLTLALFLPGNGKKNDVFEQDI